MTGAKPESGYRATAELLADRGAAVESGEFFRSRAFLEAEGVTHTLRIETGDAELLAPLIVREIADAGHRSSPRARDAISPYGYPGLAIPPPGGRGLNRIPGQSSTTAGIRLPGGRGLNRIPGQSSTAGGGVEPIDPAAVDWSATGLVSVFIRHTLAEPPLAGAADRNVVQIADPALPQKSRGSDRNRINKNRRAGYAVEVVPGPESSAEQRAGFLVAYEQTMHRTGAAERYFFGSDYFDRILASDAAWLALAHAPGGDVAAASIAVRSDGFLHYYLSGSADAHLRDSPMKNVVAALVELATERGLPLNLGGGISRGDALEEFKRGFANRELPWRVSEIVCDRTAYDRMSAGREANVFFPSYRAPGA